MRRERSNLSVAYPNGTTPVLLSVSGEPLTLPTEAQIVDVILKIKNLQETCEDLTGRLIAFGV